MGNISPELLRKKLIQRFFVGVGIIALTCGNWAAAQPSAVILTGGKLMATFADPSKGYGNDFDRLDSLIWTDSNGTPTANLVAEGGGAECGDFSEFFGESYGVPENNSPGVVFGGLNSTASNVSATTLTVTTSGLDCNGNVVADATAVTQYQVFPAVIDGDQLNPDRNEMRFSRTINFASTPNAFSFTAVTGVAPSSTQTSTPITLSVMAAKKFSGDGVHSYTPRLPDSIYDTVLIPNAAGTAINTYHASSCGNDCEETDWNGVWFADDDGSGSGMVVFRDSSSTAPAFISINNDSNSQSNLTSIVLAQPTNGWLAPVTETEWLCFYDPISWPAAAQAAGTLPQGCAQSFSAPPAASTGIPISIVGGSYSINGAAYTTTAGLVNVGDVVTVQAGASASYSTQTAATLTINGVSSNFDITTEAAPAPTVTLTANPTSLTLGQSTTLSWTTTNANSCTASSTDGDFSGSQAPQSDPVVVTPTATGTNTYTLTCTGNGGSGSGSATVTVSAAAISPTVTISANPTEVTLGGTTTLTWSSTNASSCTASVDWTGTEPTSGTLTVTPGLGSRNYYLTCTGAPGTTSAVAYAHVDVSAPPPTLNFSASPTTIMLGQSTTLTWSTTNASSCGDISGGPGSNIDADAGGNTSGSVSVTPNETGNVEYDLECYGGGSDVFKSVTVTVNPAAPPPVTPPAPTVMISINPTAITVGGSAALTWSSTNATACSASGIWTGDEPTSGSLSESPATAGTYTYTLSCSGADGTTPATASATLNVTAAALPPPAASTVTLNANPASISLGQSTLLTWSSTNAASCSASSSDNSYTGTEPTGGTISETPAANGTVTYTLTCANSAGATASSMASVSVSPPAPLAPSVTIAANPAAITLGDSTTLSWSSANATACTASSSDNSYTGTQSTSGTVVETPAAAGMLVYTLSCSGPGGTTAAATAVTVSAAVTTTSLSGKAGSGGIGLDSLFGLGALALLRRRKSFRIAVLAGFSSLLALLPTTAPALDLKFDPSAAYVGIRGGLGTYGYANNGQIGSTLASQGDAGTSVDVDRHRAIGAIYAGIPFYDRLSLEAGFVDVGEYNVHITTPSSDIPKVANDVLHDLKPAGRGLTLGLGGPVDIGRWLAAEPHFGMLIYQSKQQVSTATISYSDNSYGVGLDAGFALLLHPIRPVYFGAGIECLDAQHGCGVKLLTAQMEYHWGM